MTMQVQPSKLKWEAAENKNNNVWRKITGEEDIHTEDIKH